MSVPVEVLVAAAREFIRRLRRATF